MFRAKDLFSPLAVPEDWRGILEAQVPPWEWLIRLKAELKGGIFIHPTAEVPTRAQLEGPLWIGPAARVAASAYLRPYSLLGEAARVGHACEVKGSILLKGAQVPHLNYVGDSILGEKAHLGAGAVLANLRLDEKPVRVALPEGRFHASGLRKLGAFLGDHSQVACNAVVQPGSVLGKKACLWPCVSFGGYLGESEVFKA